MSHTVAGQLVGVLEQLDVKQIFGLIGDSLNPLADVVRRSQIEWIGVRHEEGAALAAAGQAKLTGQLAVCAGTTGPGSNHLVAGLYEASRDHAPVLALSGDMPRQMHGTDYIQTTEPDLLFRDVSLYTETIGGGAGAWGDSSGDRRRLCRPRRRAPDTSSGRALGKGRGRPVERSHPQAAIRILRRAR
jgi:pyruvate dehydrogenase (quinone)